MMSKQTITIDLLVLGGGPGGYTAAFYAADRGMKTVLVEKEEFLGGVCLRSGCIPAKALLHATNPLRHREGYKEQGIHFSSLKADLNELRAWKGGIVAQLAHGIVSLARQRGVSILQGSGTFQDAHTLVCATPSGKQIVHFKNAIVATGSKPALPPLFDLGDPRLMTSQEALALPCIPRTLLVVGGGYIGLELGTLYASLGSQVTLVEALPKILFQVDRDLVRHVTRYLKSAFDELLLSTQVIEIVTHKEKLKVIFEKSGEKIEKQFDNILVSVGRVPCSEGLGLERTRVSRDAKGFLRVNNQLQTEEPSIYAIGDISGGALLAHKAAHEAKIAIHAILGKAAARTPSTLPYVVFTDPEIAWCGITEQQAKEEKLPVKVVRFPWAASGRALTQGRTDGLTKMVVHKEIGTILGIGIVGVAAGELIGEGVIAVEKKLKASDFANLVHPHPTLSETLSESAALVEATATHFFSARTSR